MIERGLPTEGAPACPFVAFEDDRDARSTAPDHRHRCFAEPRPAPRAVAHQEAYCLSSAFPVCPTFQDWARREAAAARPAPPPSAAPVEEPPQSRAMPPLEREPRRTPGTETPPPVPPRRSQHRDWAAPPPWSGDRGDAPGAPAPGAAWGPGTPRDAGTTAGRPAAPYGTEARGLAGSAAHRLAGPDPDEPEPAIPEGAGLAERVDRLAPPDDRYGRDDHWTPDDRHPAGRGAAPGGPDDRYARPAAGDELDDDHPHARGRHDAIPPDDEWTDGAGAYVAGPAAGRTPSRDERYAPPTSRRPIPPAGREERGRSEPRAAARDQVRRPSPQDAQQLFGPAWEAPRRYEAYPSLRTRMGLPGLGGIPKIALWALVLLVAALLLFLWGPSLLGLTGGDGIGAASATPTASAEETAEPEPTEPPAPTPQVYTVKQGDTMSKIAKRFGVTVDDILKANPNIKNPDRIGIGDEITIPVPEPENGFGEESVEP